MRSRIKIVAVIACGLIMTLVACAPTSAEDSRTENPPNDLTSSAWSIEADCSMCHAAQQESYKNTACEASLHAAQSCSDCHAEEDSLAAVHEGKTAESAMTKRLKKTAVSDELCLSCHYGDKDALASSTSDIELTDSRGTSRNPHDLGGVPEHEGISCSGCHKMHEAADTADQAKKQCLNCHHSDVFECYTCHE